LTPKRSGTPPARFDRIFPSVGRIRQPTRAKTWREYLRRDAVILKLYENSQLEILRAFRDGELTIEQLVEADRNDKSLATLDDLKLRAPLWAAVNAALRKMKPGPTRGRYVTSWQALRRKASTALPEAAKVADLARVDWEALKASWGGSGSDWMHVRRAVSHTLTVMLGDKWHPYRRRVMVLIPTKREKERKPNLAPERFAAVVEHTPEHAQASYWVLVLTGMRLGEYLRCTRADLDDDTCRVHVPGTKTEDADGWVSVPAHLWGWIVSGVPSRLQAKWLREHWHRGCAAEGVSGVTLHDLRHCMGQWAKDAGADERDIQTALRHRTAAMTRRYTVNESTERVASALGKVFPPRKAGRRTQRGSAEHGA
jgi:integrase